MEERKRNMTETTEDEMEIDLVLLFHTMWRSFLKMWWLFLILIAVCAGGFLAFQSIRYEPLYASTATFTVGTGDGESGSYSSYYNASTADQLSKTFPYILNSSYFRSVLLERLGTDTLNGTITAQTIENSNVVTMRVESPSAEDAHSILVTALEIYPETARFVLGDIQFSYLNEPETPQQPFNHISPLRCLVMGGAAGVFLGLAFLGLTALFRRTVRSTEEMKKITSLRCLASVPYVRMKARNAKKVRPLSVTDRRISYGYRESIRALQTRIEKAMKKEDSRILLVTSTSSGEGKSTLAANLAEMFAMRGNRVLLIDGDLRKQTDGQMLGAKRGDGLIELVHGKKTEEEVLRKMKGSSMWFLGGSRPAKNPVSVLSSGKLPAFLKNMREKMDYIVIDTPPCGMFQDAGIFAEYADSILYVVKYDSVPQREIRAGFSSLGGRNTSFLGYVFNEYPESASEYGYGRYGYGNYGYGGYGYRRYGYGHGYGSYGERERSGETE